MKVSRSDWVQLHGVPRSGAMGSLAAFVWAAYLSMLCGFLLRPGLGLPYVETEEPETREGVYVVGTGDGPARRKRGTP